VLIVPGRAALSAARRASALAKVKAVAPGVSALDARWIHLVVTSRPLTGDEAAQLAQMLSYGPAEDKGSRLGTRTGMAFWIAPRLGTISPWSSKATDIAHVCGLTIVERIERATEWTFVGVGDPAVIGAALSDRMTESVIVRERELEKVVAPAGEPRPLRFVHLGDDGAATLREASRTMGLALADDEIDYLVARYRELGRDPTDVELMMFAQANSEHCRHKIFNAEWYVDGTKQDRSLFAWIKETTHRAPSGVLSAYKDNAAVVEGHTAARLFPDERGVYRTVTEPSHILGKVETHNHPTAISPFPGAATGSGGEIRDEGATGRGAKPKAGLVGFTVSDLRIPGRLEPWEQGPWIGKPGRIASALDIMIEGPLGGAAFNNEFGRPAILGYFRSFELEEGGVTRGYHKPVMLAGGIGAIRPAHVQKASIPEGAALVVLGGPAFLIGLGGGAASSLAQGASHEDLDFASVQRDNAEIERRCQEVIDRCWGMGDRNPILSIHDVGAGGLSNALPELVHDAGLGARLELRDIPTGEPDLSPLELWCNEAQERYVLAIAPERIGEFAALCTRERAPWAQVGTASADGKLVLGDRRGGPPPVDLPLEVVLGKPPRMTRRADAQEPPRKPLDVGEASVADALDRVLGLPTVADKSFLVTIGDRTVGGLVARDPMIGRYQVPVADCALTTAGFDTYAGEVMAIGERPPVALLDAAAASRLAIGEAITNLAAAPIGAVSRIKLSCNWMAAAGHPGEDARLYAAVRAASETAQALGIAIPVGKDSMSMRTQWNGKAVVSPVTLVVTAFGPCDDVRRAVTPELQGGDRQLLLVDLGRGRLGGSCLAQVFGQLGDTPPDLDDPNELLRFFDAIQSLVATGSISAYHDRSDGGAIVTALEMAFASGLGLELDISTIGPYPMPALFAEELGAILEVASSEVAAVRARLAGFQVHAIGRAVAGDRITIHHRGKSLLDASRTALRARWSHVTHQVARRRDDTACADEEMAARTNPGNPGLTTELTFDPSADVAAPFLARGARPRVAILREQGVNGQIEMAAAFTRAGFEAVDVHMTDLIDGRADLTDVRGAIACGGFSFGDVLGAGRGWAATFRYNARAAAAIRRFVDRKDTFLLGVCNGCQMVADLAPDLVPDLPWPVFVKNRSERFEARVVLLRIDDSPSIFFQGMQGSRIPIANAHGEGRAELSADRLAALEAQHLVAARFVDGTGAVTQQYPANPNGSPNGIAAVTTPDGRVTVIMPHPERVFRTVQLSWHPPEWGEDSPWMRMFRNARAWVG
jgi:phosphoribosylformylglycinamidine synthase